MSNRAQSARASHRALDAFRIRAAVRSDIGVVRETNEDCAHADRDAGLFAVADGVGGNAAGEVASAIAVEVVRLGLADDGARLARLSSASAPQRRDTAAAILGAAVRAANALVRRVAHCEPDKRGMSTTLDVVLILGGDAFIAHVGDSRTYLVRDGRATQLTRDHTVAEMMRVRGSLTDEQARDSPLRSVLANAVGGAARIAVDLTYVPLEAGDQLLLCSDGLYSYFSPDELAERLSWRDPDWGILELVELARQRGGHDNITGVLVEVDHGDETPDLEHEAGR